MGEVDVGPSEADVFITSSTVSAIASTSTLTSAPASADTSVMSSSASSTTSATVSYNPRPVARLPTIPSSSRSQGSPPSQSNRFVKAPAYIPIPGSSTTPYPYNAIAGPSSEGALPRRGSEDAPETPFTPSSAPATPSVKTTTHPPQYIHTHHPRRGSMTPLGLNVISPNPPFGFNPSSSASPVRTTGFTPAAYDPSASPTASAARRGSAASTCSTLTQTRPININAGSAGNAATLPASFGRERRRSSLTPTVPTLAPPSPSRTHVSGRIQSRPGSSDGDRAPPMHLRTRTFDSAHRSAGGKIDLSDDLPGEFGRRGSLPQLGYGGWTGPSTRWNPSLPPQRPSVGDEGDVDVKAGAGGPDDGFRFGTVGEPSAAAVALRAIDLSPQSRRSSAGRPPTDVFEQTEAAEAERQRRAFLAATFGEDGRRARERLSLGGAPHASGGSPSNHRRPSLMLWEKLGMAAASRAMEAEQGSTSAPAVSTTNMIAPFDDDVGPRRGSLPIAIPGGGLGRSPSRRDQPPDIVQPASEDLDDNTPEHYGNANLSPNTLYVRPEPPLLPLSDPGPRHLPSALALQRASHLLNSRNLQAEPLPHPLPPSLHPPPPIDLAEFDIDFIIAGSRSQLGGGKKEKNEPIDMSTVADTQFEPPTPTIKLGPGGEDEDTFAKFVGEFDEEYGGRRGKWSFRACQPAFALPDFDSADPLVSRPPPRSEWDSAGAGRYELYASGEVRSKQTGSIWRVRKTGSREYELEEVERGRTAHIVPTPPVQSSSTVPSPISVREDGPKPTIIVPGDCYVLASKQLHREHGGIKLPARLRRHLNPSSAQTSANPSRSNSQVVPPAGVARIRNSISIHDASPRTTRAASEDSTNTALPLSQSLPLGGAMSALMPRKQRGSRDATAEMDDRGRGSVSFVNNGATSQDRTSQEKAKKKSDRSVSKDREGDDKKKGASGLGGVFKRGLSSFKHASMGGSSEEKKALREERERERAQSQSWAGSSSSTRSRDWTHPSGRLGHSQPSSLPLPDRSGTGSSGASGRNPSSVSSADDRFIAPFNLDDRGRASSLGSVIEDDTPPLWKEGWTEGKGWNAVPDEAVAMVVPIDGGEDGRPSLASHRPHSPGEAISRQVLLVWWVPFDPNHENAAQEGVTNTNTNTTTNTNTNTNTSTPSAAPSSEPTSSISSSSIPKLQKLLRRRASKDNGILLRREKESDGSRGVPQQLIRIERERAERTDPDLEATYRKYPLPCRSFRVVARVVDIDDLRSEPEGAGSLPFDQWAEQHRDNGPNDSAARAASASSSNPSPNRPHPSLPSDDADAMSASTAPTSTILAGRTFPTVIAVCHSRAQGVEFVLEGLDRLGFCHGESAWGPTGYEEFRASGLSPTGRELIDLVWAGSTGIMGILAL